MNLPAFVFGAMPIIIQQYADYFKKRDLQIALKEMEPDLGLPRITTYDFIVVGGGTAGCVVAGELAKRYNVVLLEMGGDPSPMVYSAYIGSTQSDEIAMNPAINEIYTSIPQITSQLDNNGIAVVHAGRMLGGSGSHNGNVHNRGSPHDYDHWAQLLEDESWKYENMLRYFKASENFNGYLVNPSEYYQYYGHSGPFTVTTDTPEFLKNWFDAAGELKYPIRDPNAHQVPSFNSQQISIRNGIRESTYEAFIKRQYSLTMSYLRRGKNWGKQKSGSLKLIKYAHVHKILIDDNNMAYGVSYTRHGVPQIVHAKKEVIVSAGAFGSPIILFKSGIGPVDQLNAANIPCRKDVPGLGQNLWDHVRFTIPFSRGDNHTDPNFEEQLIKFHKPQRTGTFAQHRRTQALFVSSRAIREGEGDYADVQTMFNDNVFVPFNPGTQSGLFNLVEMETSRCFLEMAKLKLLISKRSQNILLDRFQD